MREFTKCVALLFIAFVAFSPIFEVFDKTDGWDQDTSDLVHYVICLFCLLAFSLRRTLTTSLLISLRDWIISPIQPSPIAANLSVLLLPGTKDDGLFLTLHDLRI
jgi:hypothetical protein